MIPIVLRHKLVELCINTIFDALKTNFSASNSTILSANKEYKFIKFTDGSTIRNAYVANVERYTVMGEPVIIYSLIGRNNRGFQVTDAMIESHNM